MGDASSTKSSSSDDITPIVDERIGHFLSSTPPVAELILRHLGAKDLNRCACVCKLWSKISEAEKRKRHNLLWMFQATFYLGTDVMFSGEDGHCTEDSIYMCAPDDPWGVGNHFYDIMDDSPIQPSTGIMFCSSRILSKPQHFFNGYELPKDDRSETRSFYYHEPLMQYLRTELPENCRMVCCGASGIIGTPIDNSTPSEIKSLIGFSSLMLPDIPGLKVHPFSVAEEDGLSARKRKKYDENDIARFTGIPENTNIKALLVFCEEVPDRGEVTRAIVDHYLGKQELKIAFGGAIVESVVAPMQEKGMWPMVAGIAFSGENLNAASIIIKASVQTVEELERNLNELKSGIKMGKKSLAFMFACCGKDCSCYDETNAEPKVFRKVFPDTLLLGCFCNGELGITYLPNVEPSRGKRFSVERSSVKRPNWIHGYTTIFVLLSW